MFYDIDEQFGPINAHILVPEDRNEDTPTVIFYHGWRGNYKRVLVHGRRLAEQGLIVVLPDAFAHGKREGDSSDKGPLRFFQSITHNVEEFPFLFEQLIEKEYLTDKLGVGGVSMGGITSAMLLSYYSAIDSASILMGSPELTRLMIFLMDLYNERFHDEKLIRQREHILETLYPYDLNFHPQLIENTPVLFWHGTEDDKVPFAYTSDFFLKGNVNPEKHFLVKNRHIKHVVPTHASMRQAIFLKDTLSGSDPSLALAHAEQVLEKRYGPNPEQKFNYSYLHAK